MELQEKFAQEKRLYNAIPLIIFNKMEKKSIKGM